MKVIENNKVYLLVATNTSGQPVLLKNKAYTTEYAATTALKTTPKQGCTDARVVAYSPNV